MHCYGLACSRCEIRPTHAGYSLVNASNRRTDVKKKEKFELGCTIKGRQEPCHLVQVSALEVSLTDTIDFDEVM
jgi:TatD DNase family protein